MALFVMLCALCNAHAQTHNIENLFFFGINCMFYNVREVGETIKDMYAFRGSQKDSLANELILWVLPHPHTT